MPVLSACLPGSCLNTRTRNTATAVCGPRSSPASPWKRHRSSDGNAMLGLREGFSACAVSACPAPGKLSPITPDLPPDMSLPQQRNKSPGTPRDSHDVAKCRALKLSLAESQYVTEK